MPSFTPTYALPYPADGDTVRASVQSTPKALAEAVEATVSTLMGAPAPTAWVTPTLGANWAHFGAPYQNVRYRKAYGHVEIQGLALRSSGTADLFTLPAGFRPAGHLIISTVSASAFAQFTIASTGQITLNIGSPTVWVSFNCRFGI